MGGVGLGVGEPLPADERAGPVALPGLAGADELAVLHRGDPARAVRAAVVGDAAVGRHAGAGEHERARVRAEEGGERGGIRHAHDHRTRPAADGATGGRQCGPSWTCGYCAAAPCPVPRRGRSVAYGSLRGRTTGCGHQRDRATRTPTGQGRTSRSHARRGAGKEHHRAQTDSPRGGGGRRDWHSQPSAPPRPRPTPWVNRATTRCSSTSTTARRGGPTTRSSSASTPSAATDGTPVYIYVPEGALGGAEGVDSLDPAFDHNPNDDFTPCADNSVDDYALTQAQIDQLGDELTSQHRPGRRGALRRHRHRGRRGRHEQRRARHARLQRAGRVVLRLLRQHLHGRLLRAGVHRRGGDERHRRRRVRLGQPDR